MYPGNCSSNIDWNQVRQTARLLRLISTKIPQQEEKKRKTRRARGKEKRGIEW